MLKTLHWPERLVASTSEECSGIRLDIGDKQQIAAQEQLRPIIGCSRILAALVGYEAGVQKRGRYTAEGVLIGMR